MREVVTHGSRLTGWRGRPATCSVYCADLTLRMESGGYERRRHDDAGGADQRGHIVWSFQPGRKREASYKGRRARGIGRARARHFDCFVVPPQRDRQQKRAVGPGLARRHRGRRQSAVSYRRPAQGARRREGRRTIHRHAGRAGLLLRRADLAVDRPEPRYRRRPPPAFRTPTCPAA